MKAEKADKKEKKKKGKKKAAPSPAVTVDRTAHLLETDGMEKALSCIGGKWKLRILWAMQDGEEQRYSEIKRKVGTITDVMLSQSLKELGSDGLAERKQYDDLPPRVTYRLTPDALRLVPVLHLLSDWGSTLE
ncbi:MAG: helix-turn-helix domain-containing protein [Oscillospiraceae bacterium]|nr:helix-turn-helix domain-containing protein [Oscillospiraceae bacterium]